MSSYDSEVEELDSEQERIRDGLQANPQVMENIRNRATTGAINTTVS